MSEKYIYDKEKNQLVILHNPRKKDNKGVAQFCEDYQIPIEEFNLPVVIDKRVKSCAYLFEGCTNFNQKVEIPEGVRKCNGMFYKCKNFNQEVVIPESVTICGGMFWNCTNFNQKVTIPEGVESCHMMFRNCETFNQPVQLPKSVRNCDDMFEGCKSFNQEVTIPDGVERCVGMFMGCESLNQKVIMSQKTDNAISMFRNCKSFNQKVDIPESTTMCSHMFDGCSQFNQPTIIGEAVTHGDFIFQNCEMLNQPIELCSRDCSCTDMLKGCDSLEGKNFTIHCKRIRPQTLQKRLEEIWGTEELKEGINVVYDKPQKKKEVNIVSIECKLINNEKINLPKEKIQQMTAQEIHEKLQELIAQKRIETLEMSERSDNSMKVLTVEFEFPLFAIAVIDEWTDVVYYYNSGQGGKEDVEIGGNVYPKHMVSEDEAVLFQVIDDFIKTGRPSKQVKWKRG